jgi:uncharacterized protein YdcH (DUF465 family)
LLLGQYPDYGKAEAEVLVPALQSLFMEYPEEFVDRLRKEHPRKYKFVNVAEITEELDAMVYERECERARAIQAQRDAERAEALKREEAERAERWQRNRDKQAAREAAEVARVAALTPEERQAELDRIEEARKELARNTVQEMRSQREYERRLKSRPKVDLSQAPRYPMWWLMLSNEERGEMEARGEGPMPEGGKRLRVSATKYTIL